MATIAFDTHKFVRKLKEAGFEPEQAEALTEALRAAIEDSELVIRQNLQIELAPIKSDLSVVKWMLGLLLGGVAALVLQTFFRWSENPKPVQCVMSSPCPSQPRMGPR